MLGGNPITSWPNVHVRTRDGADDPAGLEVMKTIIARRFHGWRDIIQEAQLERLAKAAGGDLRDFFRLVKDCLVALSIARDANPEAVMQGRLLKEAEEQLRKELLPVADDDARWLLRIHESKEACLPATKDLPSLARFLDGNLIMNYVNGEPWYDVHPLLLEEIRRPRPPQAPPAES